MAKRNMSPTKVEMPAQDPKARAKNFEEVTHGYTVEMAKEEAARCLQCKHKPCVDGCPVNIQIPDFIQLILDEDFEASYQKILETNVLPAVCGRVCPQESQCEKVCVRGIKHEPVAIGRLERFVADYHREHSEAKPQGYPDNGHKVAVIGSGPAGLSCAGDLARMGYQVTIFESLSEGGGVLLYGIPEFRLPKSIVKEEIKQLELDGVKIETNMVIGRIITIDELIEDYGYEAIFVGSGAGLPVFLGIPVTHGLKTLKEAVDSAFTAYMREYKTAIYCIGSVVGPHPFPMMVREFQSVVGFEAREQFKEMTGYLPDAVVACVGGGSNAIGMFSGFLEDPVDLYGIEPLGKGSNLGEHAASMMYGEKGIMHGFESIMLKDKKGEPAPVYSVASGLDYPASGPEHAFLRDVGRVTYDVISDDEAIDAFFKLSKLEGIIPAIESAHALAYALKIAQEDDSPGFVLVNLSGRGDKDIDFVLENYPDKL